MEEYDIIIIGGGPGGLTAALYSGRYKMKTLVISREPGGLAATAHKICNFPSYQEIPGMELMGKMEDQVKSFDVPILYEEVVKVEKQDGKFHVQTNSDKNFLARFVILAIGTEKRKMNIPTEDQFFGKGVSYCATCDAAFFKDKNVAVVGGSDAATTAALLLTEYAKKVYIIYRKEKLRGEVAWVHAVENNPKIEVIYKDKVVELSGDKFLQKATLESGRELEIEGLFVQIGSVPNKAFIESLGIETDEGGYIITDIHQKTNVEGIYAAGDVIYTIPKQIVTAAAHGATAAYDIYHEIKKGDQQ